MPASGAGAGPLGHGGRRSSRRCRSRSTWVSGCPPSTYWAPRGSRRCLADRLDLDAEQRACVYYTNLVLWIGCHADSHEFSRWFGDDLAMRRDSYGLDWAGLPYLLFLVRRTGSDRPPSERARLLLTLLCHTAQADGGADPLALPVGGLDGRAHRSRRRACGTPSSAPSNGGTGRGSRQGDTVPTSRCRPGWSSWRRPSRCTCAGTASRARWPWPASGAAPQFDPELVAVLEGCRADLAGTGRGRHLVRGAGSRAGPRCRPGRRRDRRAPAGDGRLRRPEVPLHRRSLTCRGRARRGRSRSPRSARHRRRRGTSCRVRARPRADGRAELGVGEAGAASPSPTRSGSASTPTSPAAS